MVSPRESQTPNLECTIAILPYSETAKVNLKPIQVSCLYFSEDNDYERHHFVPEIPVLVMAPK